MTERPSEAAVATDVRYHAVTELSDAELDAVFDVALADFTLAEKYPHNAALVPAIRRRLDAGSAEYRKRGRKIPYSPLNPTREEGDANARPDEFSESNHRAEPPDVAAPAVGPDNPAADVRPCAAECHIGDDEGDNEATMRYELPLGHAGPHMEWFLRLGGRPGAHDAILRWDGDDRDSPWRQTS